MEMGPRARLWAKCWREAVMGAGARVRAGCWCEGKGVVAVRDGDVRARGAREMRRSFFRDGLGSGEPGTSETQIEIMSLA